MSTTRRKIILVDDVEFGLMMGKLKLQEFFEVYPADSVASMFGLLETIRPDLILLDINMPQVDGYEGFKRLKADSRFADIPVIFLTSRSDDDSVVAGLGLGVADYIVKPFSTTDLQERIESILNPNFRQNVLQKEEAPLLETARGHKPCIVAVDDDPYMLRSIQYALRDKFNVYALTNPEKIGEFLSNIKMTPDLFLLDFNMPVMDGCDLFLRIREHPGHQQTPIIFLTAAGTIDNVTVAINLGASDFIVKPFSSAALLEKVAKHISKKEYFE